ncbi:MAG: ABC-2 transporter permease [Oscillospiraceae bacterium]
MSGLMQKDMCLLFQRSRVLVVLIGIGAIMGFSTDGSFVIGFLTLTCAILTVGTISYDEYDNGYPFLFTLPITRRTYVVGKYIFCMLGGLIGWCVSVAIFICCILIKGAVLSATDLIDAAAFIPVLGLITAVMIPVQLKYGAEKSRVALVAVGGGAWAIGVLAMRFLPDDLQLPAFLSEPDDLTVMLLLIGVCLVTLVVSYLISLRIMEKKEY